MFDTDFFDEDFSYEKTYDAEIERQERETGVIECIDDPDVACYRIALENEQNFSAILCAITECEANASGYVTEGVIDTARNILDKVKEAIQKFWAKVKGVFKKVTDMISSFVLTNKKFVQVYRAKADQYSTPNKKFTGYTFDGLAKDKGISYGSAVDRCRNVSKSLKNKNKNKIDVDTTLNAIRQILIHGSRTIKGDEFQREARHYLYGNKGKTITMTAPPFNDVLDNLEYAKDEKDIVKDVYKEQQDAVKELLDEIKEVRNENPDDATLQKCKQLSTIINGTLSAMSIAHSEQIKALSAKLKQNRAMAQAYIRGNKIKDYGESFDFTSGSSSLNIELV